MQLQLAIDLCNTEEMLELVSKVHDLVDIIEIGTPMIILEGQKPVQALRQKYPELTILSDTKIMDGGMLEAEYAIKAGADIVTVLAAAPDATIKGAIDTARKYGKKVLIDMINHPNFKNRVIEVDGWGADYIGVHTASDIQGEGNNPIDELRIAVEVVKNTKVSVAGGIGMDTLPNIKKIGPDVVIAGSKITGSTNPRETVIKFQEIIKA